MKIGEFCSVHLEDGCCIGRIISVNEETVDVEFDNAILTEIPKDKIMPFGYG